MQQLYAQPGSRRRRRLARPVEDHGDVLRPQHFNPVTVGIADKGEVPHLARVRALDERDAEPLEARARGGDVRDRDSQVAKALAGLLVAVGVRKGGVVFRAPVVRQLRLQ